MELEVDDDGEFLAAARQDDALVAHLLICLSRSKTCVPWHRQLPESKPPLLSPTWGRRRARSGAPVSPEGAKREEEEVVGGASPATPLSWSGASGTSGSGSDDGWSTPLRPPKRQQRGGAHEREEPGQPASMQGPEVCHGAGEQIGAPPAKGTVPESSGRGCPAPNWAKVDRSDDGGEPHRDFVVAATPVVGSPAAGSGSSKAAAAVATRELGPARSIAHAQPLRSRWTAEGANSMGVGRQGKKKTLLELRAMKDSLLREQEQLQKELGKRREIYGALLGENMSLKKLESSLPSLAASKPHVAPLYGEAISEEHQQSASEQRQEPNGVGSAYVDGGGREQPQRTSSSSSTQVLAFRFDLNCVPSDGDL